MTLEELDQKIAKEATPTVTVYTPGVPTKSESHTDWSKRRAAEDAALKDHKCPLCSADVNISVIRGTSWYTCTKNTAHTFSRFYGLGVVTPAVASEYGLEDCWE